MLCFAYPHPYVDPPLGDYFTVDEETGSGWNNVYTLGDIQNPHSTYIDFINNCPDPDLVVPITEEAILSAAYINHKLGLSGLSITSALNCVCRARQRSKIDTINPNMNPLWIRADRAYSLPDWQKCVVKAGSSTRGHGVLLADCLQNLDLSKLIQRVNQSAYYELARTARFMQTKPVTIIEHYIEGEQFEISGIIDKEGKICHWFNVLYQTWSQGKIIGYESVDNRKTDELRLLAEKIVKGFNFRGCGFNIEFRGNKVIEVHPRLGEDLGEYESKLSPGISSAQVLYDKLN